MFYYCLNQSQLGTFIPRGSRCQSLWASTCFKHFFHRDSVHRCQHRSSREALCCAASAGPAIRNSILTNYSIYLTCFRLFGSFQQRRSPHCFDRNCHTHQWSQFAWTPFWDHRLPHFRNRSPALFATSYQRSLCPTKILSSFLNSVLMLY